jgi:hypothetical protein
MVLWDEQRNSLEKNKDFVGLNHRIGLIRYIAWALPRPGAPLWLKNRVLWVDSLVKNHNLGDKGPYRTRHRHSAQHDARQAGSFQAGRRARAGKTQLNAVRRSRQLRAMQFESTKSTTGQLLATLASRCAPSAQHTAKAGGHKGTLTAAMAPAHW